MSDKHENGIFVQGMVETTAYLNWRTDFNDENHNYTVIGDGFSESAMILMDKVIENNRDKKADILIFPIFYAIDQSIEVYMKATINVLNALLDNPKEIMTSHDIRQLYNQMKGRIEKFEDSTKGLNKYLKPLNTYIEDLYQKIDYKEKDLKQKVHMDFARYPVTTAGSPQFYVENYENEVVDIVNLKRKFSEVFDCLSGLYDKYSECLYRRREMEEEAARNY